MNETVDYLDIHESVSNWVLKYPVAVLYTVADEWESQRPELRVGLRADGQDYSLSCWGNTQKEALVNTLIALQRWLDETFPDVK